MVCLCFWGFCGEGIFLWGRGRKGEEVGVETLSGRFILNGFWKFLGALRLGWMLEWMLEHGVLVCMDG